MGRIGFYELPELPLDHVERWIKSLVPVDYEGDCGGCELVGIEDWVIYWVHMAWKTSLGISVESMDKIIINA